LQDSRLPGEVVTPRWYTIEQVATMLNYGLTKTKYLVHSGRSARSRTAGTAASCLNGSMSTSASGSQSSQREQAP
jgi:hypothetical protein